MEKFDRVLVPSTRGRPTKAQPEQLAVNTSSLAADFVYRSLSASATTPPTQPSRLAGWRRSQPSSRMYSRLIPSRPRSRAKSTSPGPERRICVSSSSETCVTSLYTIPSRAVSSTPVNLLFSSLPGSQGRMTRICRTPSAPSRLFRSPIFFSSAVIFSSAVFSSSSALPKTCFTACAFLSALYSVNLQPYSSGSQPA